MLHVQTKNLDLVPTTPEEVRAQLEEMSVEKRGEISPDWLARVETVTEPDPWWLGFAIVHRATGEKIGTCGFKGPPSDDGMVEIAYGVNPHQQGNGYATEAAQALVAFARSDKRVRSICAHSLASNVASCRVLEKCGFRFVGEVTDPEDGLVWRWELPRGS